MPFTKVYLHCVWTTKHRIPFLETKEIRTKVWNHIRENARQKGIYIDTVNGFNDHCHCLISLNTDQTIQKVMQMIKGESSYWINKNSLTRYKFGWQDEYYVVSVSDSVIPKVRNYIRNQEAHHAKKTFQEEYEKFKEVLGLEE